MPRPKPVVSRARRDEWELHRRQISRLFIVDGIPVAQIAKYMEEEHGFDRTIKDYGYHLKKWNLRRNLHKSELISIQNELSRREQAGRLSEIVVSGIKWPGSMIRGRLERHNSPWSSSEQLESKRPSQFLARVQTPSPFMLGLWPDELPWIQFSQSIHQALKKLNPSTTAGRIRRPHGQESDLLLVEMIRPYIITPHSTEGEPQGGYSIHPRKRMRAILEVIAPQAHAGDHELTADIFWTGSRESLAAELVRLLIYLESNNMVGVFRDITGCNVQLDDSANMMDFLRGIGFLTKANIDWLARCTGLTTQTFLTRLLVHSITDENSADLLAWMVPDHFDVHQSMQIFEEDWQRVLRKHQYRLRFDEPPNYKPNHTMTLLQASCLAGNTSAVTLLLDLRADPYGTGHSSEGAPLECAASLGCHERASSITRLLLSKPTRITPEVQKAVLETSLQLAITGSHTELITRLISERERLGDGAISSQHFSIAAKHAECETLRLLIERTPIRRNGTAQLPEDILFSVVSHRPPPFTQPDLILEKFNYLINHGVDPSVPRCRSGCLWSSLLDFIIGLDIVGARVGGRLGEDRVLEMVKAMREHAYPQERPKPAGDVDFRPSALQGGIQLKYYRLVKYLLDWGADIDFLKEEPSSARTWTSCAVCDLHNGRVWLNHTFGRSPLLTALYYGRIEAAKMLLSRKPTLKLRGGEEDFAMRSVDDPELVTLLMASSSNVDGWKSFFESAVLYRNSRSIKLLLSMDNGLAAVDPATITRAAMITRNYSKSLQHVTDNQYDSETLFEAVLQAYRAKKYRTIIERLLQKRKSTSNDGCEIRAVAFAAMHNDNHVLGSLMRYLKQGPWITMFPGPGGSLYNSAAAKYGFPKHILSYAARFKKPFNALLDAGISAKELCDKTPEILELYSAEIWSRLIASGLEPNQGWIILPAVENNMLAHVDALCEGNLQVNAMHDFKPKDILHSASRTAIQVAVESGSPDMIQKLLHYGANVDNPAGPFRGATCLQIAAGSGNIGLVRFLLNKGARVNAKRALFFGRTAVEVAAENGRLDVLALLLLQEGPLFGTEAERYQFIRAAKLAEQNGHGSLIKLLRQYINWNSDDQRLLNKIPDCHDPIFQLDDMTQELSDSDKRHESFWLNVDNSSAVAGLDDIYDIDGIEKWIGRDSDDSGSEDDSNSEGESHVHFNGLPITAERAVAEHDDLVSDMDHTSELSLMHDNTDNAIVASEALHVEPMSEYPGNQPQALTVDSGCGQVETALAPQAIRYDNKVPAWVNMDHNIRDAADDVGFWTVAEHRPKISNLHRESGMVFGEALVLQNDELGGDVFVPLTAEDGDRDPEHFNWGCWDEEGIFREADGLQFDFDSMALD